MASLVKTEKTTSSSSSKSSSKFSPKDLVLQLTKPGQRYPMESPGSGDYVFYQSLYKENPNSRMALVWCIEHGVFDDKTAYSLIPKYQKAKAELIQINRSGSSSSSSSSSSSDKPKKKKQKVTIQGDAAVSAGLSVGISQGIGTMNEL
jgi:hypothetical protein